MKLFKVKENTGSSMFLKIEDGKSVTGLMVGEPLCYYRRFVDGKYQPCDKGDEDARFQMRVNFVTSEGGRYVSKIWEMGSRLNNQLLALQEAGYELEKTLLIVSRQGVEKQTKYSVVPKPKQIDSDALAEIWKTKLHNLNPVVDRLLKEIQIIDTIHGSQDFPGQKVVKNHPLADDIPF